MKKFFLASTICFFLLGSFSAGAADNPCAKYAVTPQLKFGIRYGNLRYDYSSDRQHLSEMAGYYNLRESGMFTAGLSLSDINGQVQLFTTVYKEGELVCLVPESLEISLGYRQPVIYLLQDLKKGSCEYNLVLRHEQQHQQISIMALEHFAPQIQRAMAQKLAQSIPFAVEDDADADVQTTALNEEYWQYFSPLLEQFRAALLKEQQKLDSRQNYEFEDKLCAKFR